MFLHCKFFEVKRTSQSNPPNKILLQHASISLDKKFRYRNTNKFAFKSFNFVANASSSAWKFISTAKVSAHKPSNCIVSIGMNLTSFRSFIIFKQERVALIFAVAVKLGSFFDFSFITFLFFPGDWFNVMLHNFLSHFSLCPWTH